MPALPHESEKPSPDEIRRRIDSLYDRAESDTGTFNPTRAASLPRQREAAARDASQADVEPAVGALARQWFDVARAKLGPTVPAWQQDRRPPARPGRASQAAPSAPQAERPAEPRAALEAPRKPTGAAWELTGGSAQAQAMKFLPELSGRPAEPAAADESMRDDSVRTAAAQPFHDGTVAAWSPYEPVPSPEPEPGPQPFAALPAVPAPSAPVHGVDLPVGTADTHDAGPVTGAPAPLATARPADLTAYPTSGPPADVTAPAWSVGVPETPAPAPPVPDTLRAPETPSAPYAPGAHDEPWPPPDGGRSPRAERAFAFARAQIGRPCVWGAAGPGSYDAPGLTQAAWKAAGVALPRTSQAQWGAGVQVPLADAQTGDLVFFHDDLGHVGVWSGDGMMIHAPGPGALIREESVFFAGRSAVKGVIRPA